MMLKIEILLLLCCMCNAKVHLPGKYYKDFRRHHHNGIDTSLENQTIKSLPNVTKVDIKVYYETLCPASVKFFTDHLRPVVETIGSYLNVHLIPFGHAEVTTKRLRLGNHRHTFRCQHGPAECLGNKLHACALHVLSNATAAVVFNACLMKNTRYDYLRGHYDFLAALSWCGSQHGVNSDQIRHCSSGRQGSELLKMYGDQTKEVHPAYVPYVVVDDSIDKQDHALSNLMMTVCSILRPIPPQCFVRRQYLI